MEPEPAFLIGMIFGALTLWFIQSLLRSRRGKKGKAAARVMEFEGDNRRRLREIDELHERLAVLERIATDPAARTAAEIENLR